MTHRPDLVSLVESYGVKLRRSGKEYVGLCPFHADKTPSFRVNNDKQVFYCHACHEGGDVINFVMKIEGCCFPEALQRLGIKPGPRPPKKRPSKKAEQAAAWANEWFLKAQARCRDVNEEIALAQLLKRNSDELSLCREFEILESISDDLTAPSTALALYRNARPWLENIVGDRVEWDTPMLMQDFPKPTAGYWAFLTKMAQEAGRVRC